MKLNDASLIIIGIIVGTCVLAGLASRWILGDDNEIEQAAEKIIKEETGVSIDLSP